MSVTVNTYQQRQGSKEEDLSYLQKYPVHVRPAFGIATTITSIG